MLASRLHSGNSDWWQGLLLSLFLRVTLLQLVKPCPSGFLRNGLLTASALMRVLAWVQIWVSHSEDQVKRLGGRILTLPEGTFHEQPPVIN